MECYINQDISNCEFVLADINKLFVAPFSTIEVNYDTDSEKIIDIYTEVNWQQLEFETLSIQTEHFATSDSYSTSIKVSLSEMTNELSLYIAEGKRFIILFIDKNQNCFCDGVLPNDNGYILENITSEISESSNTITFELNKISNYNIKEIDSNYFLFNNL